MTYYEHNNVPDYMEIEALPSGMFSDAKNALLEALESDHILQLEAKAAYAYEYKGNMELDSFVNPRNTRNNDDVILRLTVRISNPSKATDALALTNELAASVAEYLAQEKQPSLKEEIAQAEMEARQAEIIAQDEHQRMIDVRQALTAEITRTEESARNAAATAREKLERLRTLLEQ